VSCVSALRRLPLLPRRPLRPMHRRRGWILGNEIDGTQAEYVRVPFADNSTYPVPAGVSDEELLMLADICPPPTRSVCSTARSAPVTWSLSSVLARSPVSDHWRQTVQPEHGHRDRYGRQPARGRQAVRCRRRDQQQRAGSDRRGPRAHRWTGRDVAIEAVGVPATFELAADLVRPVGRIANIGVHGKPVTLHLERLWTRDVTITTGLVDTYSTPTLLRLLTSHQIDAQRFVTHHFGFDQFDEAYDVFSRAAETCALKSSSVEKAHSERARISRRPMGVLEVAA